MHGLKNAHGFHVCIRWFINLQYTYIEAKITEVIVRVKLQGSIETPACLPNYKNS